MKAFTDLLTIDDFAEYYEGASKRELKDKLKSLGKNKKLPTTQNNEKKAIIALLS